MSGPDKDSQAHAEATAAHDTRMSVRLMPATLAIVMCSGNVWNQGMNLPMVVKEGLPLDWEAYKSSWLQLPDTKSAIESQSPEDMHLNDTWTSPKATNLSVHTWNMAAAMS